MMQDFHSHTHYSDGKNTPEEMIQSAIAKGLEVYGISDHGYTSMDLSYCVALEDIPRYKNELFALKEKYADQIDFRVGIEQDYNGDFPVTDYDYAIGSSHYVYVDGLYFPVDHSKELFREIGEKHFGGDYYAMAENYFERVGDVIEKTGAQIVGHFDLICKYNEVMPLFDETHPRYVAAWKKAADKLLKTGVPFEINTGAISRGYKTIPYPRPEMKEYILTHGGSFVWGSDSHRAENIAFRFPEEK